ncbi:MAG: hypothetical protein ABL912_01765 [Novosphingobium sp.]
MGFRPDRDTVKRYMTDHPAAPPEKIVSLWPSLPKSTAMAWYRAIRKELAEERLAPPKPKLAKKPREAPPGRPEGLSDREIAVATARDANYAISLLVARIRHTIVEEGTINKDDTTALAQLQKLAAGLIDAHPNLLAVTELTEGNADRVTEADFETAQTVLARAEAARTQSGSKADGSD